MYTKHKATDNSERFTDHYTWNLEVAATLLDKTV
jgi:hypothetical protein